MDGTCLASACRKDPAIDAIKVVREWVGHYAYNAFDHNAIMGPHTDVENFIFLNGFQPWLATITCDGTRHPNIYLWGAIVRLI